MAEVGPHLELGGRDHASQPCLVVGTRVDPVQCEVGNVDPAADRLHEGVELLGLRLEHR